MSQDPEPEELAHLFRARLEAERRELDGLSETTGEDRSPVTLDQQSVGRVSRIDSLQVQAMAQAAEGRRQLRRRRVGAALARMEEGEFGYCAECGEFIGLKRLEVDPTVIRCVACEAG